MDGRGCNAMAYSVPASMSVPTPPPSVTAGVERVYIGVHGEYADALISDARDRPELAPEHTPTVTKAGLSWFPWFGSRSRQIPCVSQRRGPSFKQTRPVSPRLESVA
jgi:hypothetical protein